MLVQFKTSADDDVVVNATLVRTVSAQQPGITKITFDKTHWVLVAGNVADILRKLRRATAEPALPANVTALRQPERASA